MNVLIDPHVHIYPEHDLETVIDKAFTNFKNISLGKGIDAFAICLTERSECNYFSYLSQQSKIGEVNIECSHENILCRKQDYPALFIFPGRQTNTIEGIEVLGLFIKEALPEKESLNDVIKFIESSGGLAVINWAPGKWSGKRGRLLKNIVPTLNPTVCLGVTSLLPNLSSLPNLIKSEKFNGRSYILGSDPFPLSGEERLVASCGMMLNVPKVDTLSLKKALLNQGILCGKRDSIINIALRIIKNEIKRRKR